MDLGVFLMGQPLDCFESAPYLCEIKLRRIKLHDVVATSGPQNGQLVSLADLKKMDVNGNPCSDLLNHLLILVGTCLVIEVHSPSPPINGHPHKFLNNLRNLPNFTTIQLHGSGRMGSHVRFTGPSGEVKMLVGYSQSDETWLSLESLAQFDTLRTKWLEIIHGDPLSSTSIYQALLPMRGLRTLTLSQSVDPNVFIHALDPTMSLSGLVTCPKLEKLDAERWQTIDIKKDIGMAAARVSRGAKLKSIRIISWDRVGYSQISALELEKHVSHVECSVWSGGL